MKSIIKSTALLLFTLPFSLTHAQTTPAEQARAKAVEAVDLMDLGSFDKSIELLEEAQKLDPKNIMYPYEIAYAHYLKKDYKKAAKYLEGILKHKDADDKVYQLLGNSYDLLGKRDKAIDTYTAGLKVFPASGCLHLEMGIMYMAVKDYDRAMFYYEKGIEVAPAFSSNYYWAAKIYCNSTEEVWGMIYGELFMNIERSSKRTAEISKLLYDTYKNEITFPNDSSVAVSFSKTATMSIDQLTDPSNLKLPFGIGAYEPTLMFSILTVRKIDINTLNTIRTSFIENYYSKGLDTTYPNALFEYQKKVHDAGHLEAYNHWILMKGDENGFTEWEQQNKTKWDDFVKWFTDNGISLDNDHKFYRGQY